MTSSRFLVLSFCALSCSAYSAPTITMECWNPKFTRAYAGRGEQSGTVTTGKVQFNIHTPSSGKEVVYVSPGNEGNCAFSISSGYTITSGAYEIDPNDIFTGVRPDVAGTQYSPAKDAIKKKIRVDRSSTSDGIAFVVPLVESSSWLGTVNITFRITYSKDK